MLAKMEAVVFLIGLRDKILLTVFFKSPKERLSEVQVKRARFISASVAYTDTFKAHFHI